MDVGIRDRLFVDYSFVRFTFFDLNGKGRASLLPVASAVEMLNCGMKCYCGIHCQGPRDENVMVPKIKDQKMGNMIAIPDWDTLHEVPWLSKDNDDQSKTCQFYCSTFWNREMVPHGADCRMLLKKQLTILNKLGYRICTGVEMEFCLLDQGTKKFLWNENKINSPLILTQFNKWITDISNCAMEMDVEVERVMTEFDPGQFEIITAPKFDIEGVDSVMKLRQAIKEMAFIRGWDANFMSKISEKNIGNGLHTNISVWGIDDDKNYFWSSEEGRNNLSEFGQFWIAGLLKHASALTALGCPTVNCYERLGTPFVPSKANWGFDDRSAMIRVKTDKGQKGTYFENRAPSGLVNPYLFMCGVIAAGLDGVKKKLHLPDAGSTNAKALPKSLEESLKDLQEDQVMVEALGNECIEWFVACKTEAEIKNMDGVVNKEEAFEKYRNMYSHF